MMRMDTEDRDAFADAINQVTEAQADTVTTAAGMSLDGGLTELGWHDALADYAADAVPLLFESQGRTRTTSSALDAVLAQAAGLETRSACLVLPPLGASRAPGVLGDRSLTVHGLATSRMSTAAEVVVVARTEDKDVLVTVDSATLRPHPVHGIDPDLGLSQIETRSVPAAACTIGGTTAWADLLAAGQLALAHELVGLSRSMLEMARTHALAREQFGRPIASFQAVRHRLAESLVALEAADGAAAAAWESPSPMAASIAKALAGQSVRTVAKHAQQVLAGMGFTAEHDFHLYFKRALVLDSLLGSSRRLTDDLGRQLLARRTLPAMLPL